MIPDLLFLAAFLVALPVLAYRSFPFAMRAIVDGEPDARVREYRQAVLLQWGLCAAGIVVWIAGGRSLADLGLASPGGAGFWIALGIAGLAAAPLQAQLAAARRDEATRRELRTQLGGNLVFLPRAPEEAGWYAAVSVTAGVCEEILYRGWLIGWLAPRIGIPGALAASVVVFGLAHTYAGRTVALRAGATGIALGALYLLSGSLWVPVVLHAFIDLNAGQLSVTAFRDVRPAGAAA